LPFRDPDRLVSIREADMRTGLDRGPVSSRNFLDWQDRVPAFEAVSGWRFEYFNVAGRDEPEQVQGFSVSASYFPLLGARLAAGRLFVPDDEAPGHERVAILTEALWRRRFDSAPDLVGQTITVEGQPFTVIGILPSTFPSGRILNRPIDLFVPLTLEGMRTVDRRSHNLSVYARLKPGVTLQQAQAQLDTTYRSLAQAYPDTNATLGARIYSMPDASRRGSRPVLLLLMAAVGAVLLVACANIAGVMLARASVRQREMAVRAALGAGRAHLVRQVLTESVLLAMLGGTSGTLLAVWGAGFMNRWLPYSFVSRVHPFEINTTVFSFSVVMSLLCGLLFGVLPAAHAGRGSLTTALVRARRGTLGRNPVRRVGGLLVASELALTLVLSTGALLLVRSALLLQGMSRGLDMENVLTLQLWLPAAKYAERYQIVQFYQQVLERVARVPGVEAASLINFPPLAPQDAGISFDVDGLASSADRPNFFRYAIVDPDYLRTVRIPVIAGRAFTDTDADEARGVAIISASMARRLWPNTSAIGHTLRPHFPDHRDFWHPLSDNLPWTIVGVVGDVREDGLAFYRDPATVYVPYQQNPASLMHVLVRTQSHPLASVNAVRQAVWSVDRDQPVFDVKTMEDLVAETFGRPRLIAGLTGSLAAAAILLAAVGVFGLLSYLVSQQRSEIGIRVALGAEPRHILGRILGEGTVLGLTGVCAGLLVALAATRLVSTFLFGVRATDPTTFAVVAGLLLAVTLAACAIPALRAMRTDPMSALRAD
jgi:putative ABC transport system permease protein